MSEAMLWSYIRDGMGPLWEAQRIEDRHSTGIPDVAYSATYHGWIELKYRDAAPKSPKTKVRIKHYTPEQKNWIERHGSRGGLVFLLLQVGDTYMLFDWRQAKHVGDLTMDGLLARAVGVWHGWVIFEQFARLLRCSAPRIRPTFEREAPN